VHTGGDFGLALVAFLLLTMWSAPPWLVVILGALAGSGTTYVAQSMI
jgi:chromate transporter